MKIPKIIHRVWLGHNPLPEEFKEYGKTWAKHHPEWDIILWTEETLPSMINKEYLDLCNTYSEMSDIIRYELLYQFGGIYIDTDFECLKPIDELVEDLEVFASTEDNIHICGGFFGSVPKHPLVKQLIDAIPPALESSIGKTSDWRIGPRFVTSQLKGTNITILPKDYFYPYLPGQESLKNNLHLNDVAYAAHHWAASWIDKKPTPSPSPKKQTTGDLIDDTSFEVVKKSMEKHPFMSIVIPYRMNNIQRKDAMICVVKELKRQFPSSEIILGYDNKNTEFSRALAINNGVRASKGDLLFISDSDMMIPNGDIRTSLEMLDDHEMVIPYGKVYDLYPRITEKILKSCTRPSYKILRAESMGVRDIRGDRLGGGMLIISREYFDEVGEYDERFVGWGWEDTAFCWKVDIKYEGYGLNTYGEAYHLWHERDNRTNNQNAILAGKIKKELEIGQMEKEKKKNIMPYI